MIQYLRHNIEGFLDFSFPREDLLRHKPRLKKLVVLDHHATAEKNLEGLDFCVFDMDRSGARIAWDYFHPEKEAPLLIRHIEDRDLWRFKLPHTAEVHMALCAEPFDFNTNKVVALKPQAAHLGWLFHQNKNLICLSPITTTTLKNQERFPKK